MTSNSWTPASHTTKAAPDFVIEQIREALISRELKPGDRLPSEMELASMFNVSRGSVRQAMKSLEILGVISILPGNGTYINTSASKKSMNPLSFELSILQPSSKTVVDARCALERDILELVMKEPAIVEQLLPLLTENLDQQKQLREMNASAEQLVENDIAFHKLISKHCQNIVLDSVYDYVMDSLRHYIVETTEKQIAQGEFLTFHDHELILDALKTNDYSLAKKVAENTANTWYRLMEKA